MPRGLFGRLWLVAVGLVWVGWLAGFPDLSSRLAHTEEQRASVKALLAQNFVIRGLIRVATLGEKKKKLAVWCWLSYFDMAPYCAVFLLGFPTL